MEEKIFTIKSCATCGNPMKIDIERIKNKLDIHFDKKEFDQADRLLKYWIEEAKNSNDKKAELEIQNEYMGFLRKTNRKEEAIACANRALNIVNELGLDENVSGATILLNIATVYKAFGNPKIAISYFNKAKEVYEKNLKENDKKLAGLYNNMALAEVDLKNYDSAKNLYEKAIKIMLNIKNGELDAAISYLNYADLIYAIYNEDTSKDYTKYSDKIEDCINKAYLFLNKEDIPHDEYYRFVCEKCASSFGFYGHFMYEKELLQKIEKEKK